MRRCPQQLHFQSGRGTEAWPCRFSMACVRYHRSMQRYHRSTQSRKHRNGPVTSAYLHVHEDDVAAEVGDCSVLAQAVGASLAARHC